MDKHVYIVEDADWLRDILKQFLSLQPGLAVCGTAAGAAEALRALPAGADVVTVDLALGKGRSGLELVAAIRDRWPDLPCVVFSGQPEAQIGYAARAAGAVACVEKGDEDRLVRTLYDVLGITGREPA